MRSTRQSPKRHSPLRETFKPALKKKKKQRIAQTHFSNSRETNTQFTEKKMHDFCFTIPYGLILVGGGIVGYLKKGSVASLGGGVGTGLLLILAGYLSLKAFEKKKNSYFALALETVCAIALTVAMGQRYMQTSKIMPAGIVAGISAIMTGFYLYKIATGGNHIPVKAE